MKKVLLLCFFCLSLFADDSLSDQAYNEYKKGNYNKSIDLYLENSKTNDLFMIDFFKIGLIYKENLKDDKKAVDFLQKSSNFYYIPALEKLAFIHASNNDFLDYEKAFFNWIMAYELNKLSPDYDKEKEKQIKDNLNYLYEKNKKAILLKSQEANSVNNILLGFAWDLCLEGTPGNVGNEKIKYCDTKTAQDFFNKEIDKNYWGKYKSYEILERWAMIYKPSNKGEKENLMANKEKYKELSKLVLDGYKSLSDEFRISNIKLALTYLNGTISEKNKEEAKKYLKKAYNQDLILLSSEIWAKYNLDK